jgi:flagellar basal-body rod protein FlgF
MEENDWADLEMLDTLKVVRFEGNGNRFLKKQGSSLWNNNLESGEAFVTTLDERPKVLQGFLEASNVNPVSEMVNMIEVNRAYEANQKVISSQDSLLNKLINGAAKY